MPFTTPDYTAIRDAILRDIANQIPEAAVGNDSDYGVRAAAVGAAIEGLYQHQQWIARQILPDTADTDFLERWASLYGLTRRPAAVAAGSVVFGGSPGASVVSGLEVKTLAGVVFVTTALGVVGVGGSVSVAAQAMAAGAAGQQDAGTAVTVTAPPAGVLSTATLAEMTGGADAESDAGLLDRLLERIRHPPQGGAAHDYLAWALAVPGVASAHVFGQRRGPGTVDVVILAAGGLPDSQLIDAVAAAVDALRPVTADVWILGPTPVPVAVTASLTLTSGVTLASVAGEVESTLAAYIATLRVGDTLIRSRLLALIADTPGVADVNLVAPATNVATTVDALHVEMVTLGTVTLT